MKERRRHIRVQTPVLIDFVTPATAVAERSFTQDVSEWGCRFPTAAKLSVGQELDITIRLPFSDEALKATGEVVWVREVSRLGAPQYDVGVRFRWIEDPDRRRLVRHLAGMLRQAPVVE